MQTTIYQGKADPLYRKKKRKNEVN